MVVTVSTVFHFYLFFLQFYAGPLIVFCEGGGGFLLSRMGFPAACFFLSLNPAIACRLAVMCASIRGNSSLR